MCGALYLSAFPLPRRAVGQRRAQRRGVSGAPTKPQWAARERKGEKGNAAWRGDAEREHDRTAPPPAGSEGAESPSEWMGKGRPRGGSKRSARENPPQTHRNSTPHKNHLRTNRVCRAEDGANPGPHLWLWGPAVCPNTPYRLNGSQWSSSTPCGAQNPLSRYHLQGWKEGSLPLFYGAERIQRRPQRPMAAKTPTSGLSHPIKKEENHIKDIK